MNQPTLNGKFLAMYRRMHGFTESNHITFHYLCFIIHMDVNTLLLEDPVIKRYLQQYLDIHKLACLWMCFLELSLVFTQTQVKLCFGKLIIVQYVFRSCLKNKILMTDMG